MFWNTSLTDPVWDNSIKISLTNYKDYHNIEYWARFIKWSCLYKQERLREKIIFFSLILRKLSLKNEIGYSKF